MPGLGSTKKNLIASGIRGPLGNVNLTLASLDECGAGKYTYEPYRNFKPMPPSHLQCHIWAAVESRFIIETLAQRTADWFTKRQFRISSTVAYIILHSLGKFLYHKHSQEERACIDATLEFIGINKQADGIFCY